MSRDTYDYQGERLDSDRRGNDVWEHERELDRGQRHQPEISKHIRDKAHRFLAEDRVREIEPVLQEDREFRVGHHEGGYVVAISPTGEVLCHCKAAELGRNCSHATAALWYAEGGKERAA